VATVQQSHASDGFQRFVSNGSRAINHERAQSLERCQIKRQGLLEPATIDLGEVQAANVRSKQLAGLEQIRAVSGLDAECHVSTSPRREGSERGSKEGSPTRKRIPGNKGTSLQISQRGRGQSNEPRISRPYRCLNAGGQVRAGRMRRRACGRNIQLCQDQGNNFLRQQAKTAARAFALRRPVSKPYLIFVN
jgi:hypothetical protein